MNRAKLLSLAVCSTLMMSASSSQAAVTTVPCTSYEPLGLVFKIRPAKCPFHVEGSPLGSGFGTVYVDGLRWRTWGKATATATGTERGNMGAKFAARVVLSRRLACSGGKRIYTHARIYDRRTGKMVFSLRLLSYSCDA